jgi:solute carrier family 6 GABA transporter-like protein 1
MSTYEYDCHLPSGVDRFYDNLKEMIGYYPCVWWKIAWKYTCPAMCAFVFVFSLVQYERPKYLNYTFPLWGELLGWALALSSMLAIPVYMLWLIVRSITRPTEDQRHLSFKEKIKPLFQADMSEFIAKRKVEDKPSDKLLINSSI